LSHFDKPSTETIKNAEQLKVVNELFAINRDIDPDYNYLQAKQLMSVNYILPNEFKDCIKNPSITSNNFSILHFNARSLVNKIDNVINFLDELAFEFAILAVTETWANSDNDSRLNIPGYKLYNKNRPSKRGGGVAAYIKESLCFVARNDLDQYYSDEFEFLCVKVLQGKFHNNIVVIYRPPNANIAVFTDTYNKLMTKLSKEKCVTYVAGDFNINLLNYETHNDTNCFLNTAFEHHHYPVITRPTRFGDTRSTLIDNIFTNNPSCDYVAGLFITDLSDHLPIFYIASNKLHVNCKTTRQKEIRSVTDASVNSFLSKLQTVKWDVLNDIGNVNERYNQFIELLESMYNEAFPVKIINITDTKSKRSRKPWITSGLMKSICNKNKLYKKFITSRTEADNTNYKRYRNKLTHLLRCAKSNYYLKKFTEVQQDIGETWKLIKQVVNENRAPIEAIETLTINNSETTNMQNIVNHFNAYFTNVGKSLAEKVPQSRGNHSDTITAHYTVSDAMFIKPTDKTEISNIVHNLKLKKSTGHDGFSTKVIKAVIDCIAQPFADICNLSFSSAVFPDKLKIAKICPVYKSEDKKMSVIIGRFQSSLYSLKYLKK